MIPTASESTHTADVLSINNLTKKFGDFTVFEDLSFDVSKKGITALIGPNGAGKTTTYNLLSGKLTPTTGKIIFDGEDITDLSVTDRVKRGLSRSFQITNLYEGLTVRQNLRIPIIAQSDSRFSLIRSVESHNGINREVAEYLELLNLTDQAEITCEKLPYGAKRRVDLGIALATNPKLLILDEPTTGMTPEETSEMVKLIKMLDENTETTFFVTEHDMNVIFSLASKIIVLHQGEIIASGIPEQVRQNENVQTAYLGTRNQANVSSNDQMKSKTSTETSTQRAAMEATDPFLEIECIDTYYGKSHILNEVSLNVKRGEIVGLLGRNGAGKTTLLRSIIGHTPPRIGEIRFKDDRIDNIPPHQISKLGLGYVPEEREVFEELTIEENLDIALKEESSWSKEEVYNLFPSLREKSNDRGDQISGGQQQMLSIGRALVSNSDLLLLDEPSEGLAPVILEELHTTLHEISESGITILLTEQNTEFAFGVLDRCYLLDNGQIEWNGTPTELQENQELIDKHLSLANV